jgi:hypothetical protein
MSDLPAENVRKSPKTAIFEKSLAFNMEARYDRKFNI